MNFKSFKLRIQVLFLKCFLILHWKTHFRVDYSFMQYIKHMMYILTCMNNHVKHKKTKKEYNNILSRPFFFREKVLILHWIIFNVNFYISCTYMKVIFTTIGNIILIKRPRKTFIPELYGSCKGNSWVVMRMANKTLLWIIFIDYAKRN